MTQVKLLAFDSSDSVSDFLKVVTDEGTHLLITEERGDDASVLKDLADGLFEDFGWSDTPEDVAEWDTIHPNARVIFTA